MAPVRDRSWHHDGFGCAELVVGQILATASAFIHNSLYQPVAGTPASHGGKTRPQHAAGPRVPTPRCGSCEDRLVMHDHAHEHETGTASIDHQMTETWLQVLEQNAVFDRPWVEAAVDWLVSDSLPDLAVDVGCGAGGAACAFAQRLGPSGRVVALDRDPRLIAIARRRARVEGISDRIGWATADVGLLPGHPRSVDLVWASGVVHHLADQQAGVDGLAGLLRSGGRVALVEGGLPLRCLPHEIGLGQPGIEARLDEARERWFVDMRAELDGPPLPYGWPEALARAGLIKVGSRSFLAERPAPLDEVGQAAVEQHLRSALDQLGDRLDPDDRTTVARLLTPDDPAYVRHRTDLTVTAVRTVHVGTAPG